MIHKNKIPLLWFKEVFDFDELITTNKFMDKKRALSIVRRSVMRCKKCSLYKFKKNYVFGAGNPYSSLLFIGEAPGKDEDHIGIPFVGKAGQLLTELLKEQGIDREKDCYITNVLKCRPPNNRNPLRQEVRFCSSYLEKQIKIINPAFICALGRFAASFLMEIKDPRISTLRGKIHTSKYGIPLLVTYHPAAVLRKGYPIEDIRADFKVLKELLKKKFNG